MNRLERSLRSLKVHYKNMQLTTIKGEESICSPVEVSRVGQDNYSRTVCLVSKTQREVEP